MGKDYEVSVEVPGALGRRVVAAYPSYELAADRCAAHFRKPYHPDARWRVTDTVTGKVWQAFLSSQTVGRVWVMPVDQDGNPVPRAVAGAGGGT
jgi:hypothetical protein